MDEVYKAHIIEHSMRPQNKGVIPDAVLCSVHNATCGDSLSLYILENESRIERVSFTGECCALATASASLFTEFLQGKSIAEVQAILPKDIYDMLGITVSPQRAACVLLPLSALQQYFKLH
ncbi:MAG: hypothetical protein RI996_143 [Candidatus Parcubacteria bacterium]|jgi:nitrogen fixation NifU-like protein